MSGPKYNFEADNETWDRIMEELKAPPRDIPRLREALQKSVGETDVFEDMTLTNHLIEKLTEERDDYRDLLMKMVQDLSDNPTPTMDCRQEAKDILDKWYRTHFDE